MDPRVDKVAEILVNYCTGVRPGDRAMIHLYDPLAEPLALAVYKHVLLAGGYGIFRMEPTGADEIFLKYATDEQLSTPNPLYKWLVETIDVRFALRATSNTRALSNVDPDKMARYQKSSTGIMKTFMDRSASGALRWVVNQHPTQASAQDAEMSLSEYQEFVYGACGVHLDDPLAYWRARSAEQQRLCDWLKNKKQMVIKGEHIDLSLSVEGRIWENADGKYNFPDGEIFTGPVEESVNGWVRFSYPAIYGGREVVGVELTFEHGKAVKASAQKGEEFLISTLDTDVGARYLGEFAIGTNEEITRFTRNTLFDEKIGGTVHMALGASYPETGGRNESAIHWDMICDMRSGGEIYVDGDLFYQNGKFLV